MAALTKEQIDAWNKRNQQAFQGILDVNQFIPVSGDVQSGLMAADDLRNQQYGSAALNAVGLLPFIPSLGGIIKGSKLINIPLNQIEHGESAMPGGKLRFDTAKDLIKDYASRETPLPPIEVVSNEAGSKIPWMIYDGSHRFEAAKLKGMDSIPAYISPYDKEGLDYIKKYKQK